MRLRGFVSALSVRDIADGFRQSLGKPLVENTLGNKLVLGRAQGEHYLSVQIEPARAGSRGIVAVTDLQAAHANRSAAQASRERWLARLPPGSRLISQMESQDAGRLSLHIVFTNSQDEALNRDRLVSVLTDEGLALEREGSPDPRAAMRRPDGFAESRLLFFKGVSKEAMATVYRQGAGQTTVVLNISTSLERMR